MQYLTLDQINLLVVSVVGRQENLNAGNIACLLFAGFPKTMQTVELNILEKCC